MSHDNGSACTAGQRCEGTVRAKGIREICSSPKLNNRVSASNGFDQNVLGYMVK